MDESSDSDIETLARSQGHARDYFGVLMRLSYLAPDITAAILEGRQPGELTRQRLARCKIALSWEDQRIGLGFPEITVSQ